MAWKGKPSGVNDPDRLFGIVNESKAKSDDPSLFQTVTSLVTLAQQFRTGLVESFNKVKDKLDLTEQVEKVLPPSNGGSYSLYYIPTLTDIANVTLSSEFYTFYYRVGKTITVFGKAAITPTAGATITEFEISLPVPSKFASADQLSGLCVGHTDSGVPTTMTSGIITGNTVTQAANVKFFSLDTGIHDIRFQFSFELF